MSVDLWDVLKAVTPVVISIVGWGVKQVYNEIRAQRQELREYVRQETCKAHREHFQRQLDALAPRRRESDIAQL